MINTNDSENAIQAEERKLQAIESFLPYFSLRANKAFPEPDTRYVNLARSAVSLYLRQRSMRQDMHLFEEMEKEDKAR